MVDITPGDSGANKGYWRKQIRDRYGRWVQEGNLVSFKYQLPGVDMPSRAVGRYLGSTNLGLAEIEVETSDQALPKGIYSVDAAEAEMESVEAIIPQGYMEEKTSEALNEDKPLLQSVSGSQVLKTRLRSVASALREEGRFPIPRIGLNQEIGEDTDMAKGARIDYKKVYDASPEVQENFDSFENMWDYVVSQSTDSTTQSPNNLDEIPEKMRVLNRAYAEHILNMSPDGLITVYRNSVNNKSSQEDAAAGYVSLDKNFAFDYASTRGNEGANGRYEIKAKPEELFGMLGYSKIEDEYALTVGTGVTSQKGRVKRVGDVEILDLDASWLKDWGRESFNRNAGGTPYRFFDMAGEFDFHKVDYLGDSLNDFLEKHDLQSSDVKDMFERLHGEGSYDEYRESGNTLNFANIKNLFIELPDGKYGLDVPSLTPLQGVKQNSEYKNDRFDNTLKMLSTIQELSGDYFMTHKTRSYDTYVDEKKSERQATLLSDQKEELYNEDIIDGDYFDTSLLRRRNPKRIYPNDAEVFEDDQLQALKWYAQQGHRFINKHLRGNEDTSDENKDYIFLIDEAIEENGEVFEDSTVFRGDMPLSGSPYMEFLENLEEGAVVSFPEFLSTSNDASIAFNEFGPGMGSETTNNAMNEHTSSAFFWTIDVPEGSTAMGMPEGTGYQGDAESEVLLPRNSELEITEIKKVPQTDPETGEENGNFNYFFQARVQQKAGKSFERSDYAGTHEAPGPFSDVSVQIENIEQNMPNFGNTLSEVLKNYGTGMKAADEESATALLLARALPGAPVTVYRAVPEGVDTINEGDWVSLSQKYAQQHLQSNLLGKGRVIEMQVPAKELWTDGDSINELGWDPRSPNDVEQETVETDLNEVPAVSKYARKVTSVDEPKGSPALQEILEGALQSGKENGWEPVYEIDEESEEIVNDEQDERAKELGYIDSYAEEFVRGWPSSFEYVTAINERFKEFLDGDAKINPSKITDKEIIAGLELVEASPKTEVPVFRGIRTNKETVDKYVEGATVDLPFSAFSMYQNEIKQYWQGQRNDVEGGGLPVEYELEPGAKAIPMMPFDMQAIYGEFVTSGRYEIVSVTKSDNPSVPTRVKIRHVSTFDPSDIDEPISSESKPEVSEVTEYREVDLDDVPEFEYQNMDQRLALLGYTQGSYGVPYSTINKWLRNGELSNNNFEKEEVVKAVEDLKELVNSTEIPEDIKVVRYQKAALGEAGDEWISKGFLSTSTFTRNSGDPVVTAFSGMQYMIEINIPKGSKGGAVPRSVEGEVLLPPNSRFRIDSVESVDPSERMVNVKVEITLIGQDE